METNEIKNSIFDIFHKYRGYFLATGFSLVMSIVFAFVLNIFVPLTIVILFAILIIPILSLMIINLSQARAGKPLSLKDFYKGYKLTLLPGLHGSFRVIRATLYSILIYIGTFLIVYLVTSIFTNVVDQEFIQSLQQATSIENQYKMIMDYYETPAAQPYLQMYSIFSLVSFGVGEFFFIHFTLKSVPIFYLQSNMACSKKDAIFLFNQVYPKTKKTSRQLIGKVCGLYYLLFPLGYFLGVALGYFVLGNILYGFLFGLFFSLLFSMPMLPLYLICQDYLFVLYMPLYKMFAKPLYEAALKNLDEDERVSEEQKTVIRQFYETQLKEIEELEKVQIITQQEPEEIAKLKQKEKEDEEKKNNDK